jgi:hypothetical protein
MFLLRSPQAQHRDPECSAFVFLGPHGEIADRHPNYIVRHRMVFSRDAPPHARLGHVVDHVLLELLYAKELQLHHILHPGGVRAPDIQDRLPQLADRGPLVIPQALDLDNAVCFVKLQERVE